MRIGIDIGGVIIASQDRNSDTSFFSDNFLATPAEQHALTSVRRLAKSHEVFLISKAGPRTVEKTLLWLDNRAFLWKAGVSPDRLVFCQKRWQKAPIAHLLELDIFIDDRQDICDSMEQVDVRPIRFENWEKTLEILAETVEL